jgi:hypothetical protein
MGRVKIEHEWGISVLSGQAKDKCSPAYGGLRNSRGRVGRRSIFKPQGSDFRVLDIPPVLGQAEKIKHF